MFNNKSKKNNYQDKILEISQKNKITKGNEKWLTNNKIKTNISEQIKEVAIKKNNFNNMPLPIATNFDYDQSLAVIINNTDLMTIPKPPTTPEIIDIVLAMTEEKMTCDFDSEPLVNNVELKQNVI